MKTRQLNSISLLSLFKYLDVAGNFIVNTMDPGEWHRGRLSSRADPALFLYWADVSADTQFGAPFPERKKRKRSFIIRYDPFHVGIEPV
jgi:hypothetical protein